MMNNPKVIAATLHAFWSGFGVRAWTEEAVPSTEDDGTPLKPPYITYSFTVPTWRESEMHQVRIWTQSESNEQVFDLAGKVLDAIGEGITLPAIEGKGYVTIDPGEPLVQLQPIDEPEYKVAYINLILGAIIAQKG